MLRIWMILAVKIKRSPVENTHKMLRIWMGKKRSGRTDGEEEFRSIGLGCSTNVLGAQSAAAAANAAET